jgi:hypothetical protein
VRRAASWHRGPYPNAYTVKGYYFSNDPWPIQSRRLDSGGTQLSVTTSYEHGNPRTVVVKPWSGLLMHNQRVGKVPGTVLFLLFLVAAVGLVPRNRSGNPNRSAVMLVWTTGLALAFVPILTVQLDYRYLLPSTSFAALAAVLAVARFRASPQATPAPGPGPDASAEAPAATGEFDADRARSVRPSR